MNEVVNRIKELEYSVMNYGNREMYIDNINRILTDFINNKINEEIMDIDLNILFEQGLASGGNKVYESEKLLSLFNIIGGKSDLIRIDNPTEERKNICNRFNAKFLEYFEKLVNSVDLEQLQSKIENEAQNDDLDYDEDTIIDQAYYSIAKLSKLMAYNSTKLRSEAINKIEKTTEILKKKDESKLDIPEYKIFQEGLQEILMDNICKFSQYSIVAVNEQSTEDKLKYSKLCEEYLNLLIDSKVNILIRDGRVLRNYLSIANANPQFDELGILKKVNEAYNLNDVNIQEESRFLNDFIENNSLIDEYEGIDIEQINSFLEHLQLVKLKNKDFTIPRKYINYIIENAYQHEGIAHELLPLMETAFEDLGKEDLRDMIGDTKKYLFCVRNFIQGSTIEKYSGGGTGEYGIMYSRKEIEQFSKRNPSILEFCFHENTHLKQKSDMAKPEIVDYKTYQMEKDDIIMKLDPYFYPQNYKTMFIELDANLNSAIKTKKFLHDFKSLTDNERKENDKKYTEIVDVKQFGLKHRKNVLFKGKIVDFNDFFDTVIEIQPELIKKHPHLKVEYKENGEKKSLREIVSQSNIKDDMILCDIITDGKIMNADSFSDDMDFLIEQSEEGDNDTVIFTVLVLNMDRVFSEEMKLVDEANIEKLTEISETINKMKNVTEENNSAFYRGMNTADIFTGKKNIDILHILEEKVDKMLSNKKLEKDVAKKDSEEKGKNEKQCRTDEKTFLEKSLIGISEDEIDKMLNKIIEKEDKDRVDKKRRKREKSYNRENDYKKEKRTDKNEKDERR